MKIIEQAYFNQIVEEKLKLKDIFNKMAKDYSDFESVLAIVEEDLKNHYNVEQILMNTKF